MALPNIDLEALTDEDLTKLAEECLGRLDLEVRVGVVVRCFAERTDRDELISWLEDESEEA